MSPKNLFSKNFEKIRFVSRRNNFNFCRQLLNEPEFTDSEKSLKFFFRSHVHWFETHALHFDFTRRFVYDRSNERVRVRRWHLSHVHAHAHALGCYMLIFATHAVTHTRTHTHTRTLRWMSYTRSHKLTLTAVAMINQKVVGGGGDGDLTEGDQCSGSTGKSRFSWKEPKFRQTSPTDFALTAAILEPR